MSKLCPSLLALACLAAPALAQVNPFIVYPQDPERQTITCTSYVGRPDQSRAAEALVALSENDYRGIGDANGIMRIFGVYHWAADEKLLTSETYDLVLRKATATGEPDMTASGQQLRISALSTPPSTSTSRGTWIMYDGFNLTGGQILTPPNTAKVFIGISLPASPQWPATDGHALHRADMLTAGTAATVGENHRAGASSVTWAGLPAGAPVSTPWSYILGPFVTSPNLHLGGEDQTSNRLGMFGGSFGLNGMYPDVGGSPRRDGLRVRITDNLSPYSFVFLGASRGWQPSYYVASLGPGLIGFSHIGDDLNNRPISIGFALMYNSQVELMLGLWGRIPTNLVGRDLAFQAIVWDPTTNRAEWTNAQMAHF